MLTSIRMCFGAALVAAAFSSAASAATLTVDRFDRGDLGKAHAAMSDYVAGNKLKALDTFEEKAAWNPVSRSGTGNPATKVGSFTSFGKSGSGHSVIGDNAALQVRADDTMEWGRYSADNGGALGGHWLDSNDNLGARWEVSGLGKFNTLAFFVTDAADVGGKFSIKVGDQLFSNIAGGDGKLKSGNIQFVRIMLDKAVSKLTVELMHDRTNDGFGIDGAAVGLAPIPLPPAALLLGSGLLGLVALRRRKAAAAA
jgi:hypothetical protein